MREALEADPAAAVRTRAPWLVPLSILVYVVALALPYVPGVEIGIALLVAFGAGVAPLVYGATVAALMLAYAAGRLVPVATLAHGLAALRLHRAAALVARAAPLSADARLALLTDGSPRLLGLALRHRYLALALAVNLPGNALVGGGGGIMLMAGLSGIFAPLPTLVAIAVAVSPVPLAFLMMGP
jgi:hypothetical protein